MKTRNLKGPVLVPTIQVHKDVDANFRMISNHLATQHPVTSAVTTKDYDLVVGDNEITVSGKPSHRLTTYMSLPSTLFDKGLNAAGKWVVVSTAVTTCRFMFF